MTKNGKNFLNFIRDNYTDGEIEDWGCNPRNSKEVLEYAYLDDAVMEAAEAAGVKI